MVSVPRFMDSVLDDAFGSVDDERRKRAFATIRSVYANIIKTYIEESIDLDQPYYSDVNWYKVHVFGICHIYSERAGDVLHLHVGEKVPPALIQYFHELAGVQVHDDRISILPGEGECR